MRDFAAKLLTCVQTRRGWNALVAKQSMQAPGCHLPAPPLYDDKGLTLLLLRGGIHSVGLRRMISQGREWVLAQPRSTC